MEIQEAYKQKIAAQVKEWDAKNDLLVAKIENAGADIVVKRAEMLHELRAKQRAAADEIQELEKVSGETWEQVKETADKIWEDLRVGIAEAQSKFK